MSPQGLAGPHNQFGDTTFTKVFVGGLAWETQKETMRKYFDQFGEILEAVVITDKNTGRSKGYGFVTFREPEAARRACVDAAPVIDGRRANCNLASFGVQKSRPTTPQHGGMRNIRMSKTSSFTGFNGGMRTATTAFASPAPTTFPHYAIQQGLPYNLYGYSPYSPDYGYPMNYYNIYGGTGAQYPIYGGASGLVNGTTNPFYPFFQFSQGGGGNTNGNGASGYAQGQGYGLQYSGMFPYSATGITGFAPQHYGGPLPLPLSPPAQPGITMALTAPTLPSPQATLPYRFISTHFSPAAAAPEQPLA